MPNSFIKTLIKYTFIVTLVGCANKPSEIPSSFNWQGQTQKLTQFNDWQIRGKLAYKKGEEKFSANIRWEQTSSTTHLRLFNTLGVVLIDMFVEPDKAELKADGKRYIAPSAEQLLYDTTGWDIPVTELVGWVKGLTDKNDTVIVDETGKPKTLIPACLNCEKWKVEYGQFILHQGLMLPKDITLRQNDAGKSFIKLRITKWQ